MCIRDRMYTAKTTYYVKIHKSKLMAINLNVAFISSQSLVSNLIQNFFIPIRFDFPQLKLGVQVGNHHDILTGGVSPRSQMKFLNRVLQVTFIQAPYYVNDSFEYTRNKFFSFLLKQRSLGIKSPRTQNNKIPSSSS
eukprot:TRINITY_DN12203_c0_g1_i1.p1 TRINITY_DN12203_c0_g1~~TRINITY_DN12203_c0_g1_i1.p1  ORF type:complete len:157 (+),score=16.47 TRINITY_DN12203_c0_g1_i1:61-471(+)